MHASFSDIDDGPSLLSGLVRPVEISELLATLPAKPAVDRLLSRFFDSHGLAVPPLSAFSSTSSSSFVGD